ncbi:unnamed protein product, partial [Mesorhabditis spiculigera]
MGEPATVGSARDWSERLKGWLFGFFMLSSTVFGAIYIFIPFTPLIFFYPRAWRRFADHMNGTWHSMAGSCVRLLFGVKTRIVGDKADSREMAIYIMNHRTSLDWFFFWNGLYQQDPSLNHSEKIALKGMAKHCPGAGWAMQCNSFIFLDRKMERDKERVRRLLDYYVGIGNNYQILLFPEGTDRCPISIESNEKYAAKMGLAPYSYLLHPRTTGFVFMVQQMRKTGKLKAIYDVTVGYKDKIVQTETDIIMEGVCPQEVHYQMIRIPIDQLPLGDQQLADWLVKRWADKEEKLRQFYGSPREQTFDNTPTGQEYFLTPEGERRGNILVIGWTLGTFAWIFGLLPYPMLSLLTVYGISYYLIVCLVYGGVEFLAIERFRAWESWNIEQKWSVIPETFQRVAAKLPFGFF